ncbi:MAG: Zn-ribbon domain-containing OB-fold protein [Porticoccaceae bacterium]
MTRPIPRPTRETEYFWQGCLQNQLRFQHCPSCNQPQFPPRIRCHSCHKDSLVWRESTKRGTIYSSTTVMRGPNKAFNDNIPYVIALIDLEEGFRIMANIVNADSLPVEIGTPIQIIFESVTGQTALPQAEIVY